MQFVEWTLWFEALDLTTVFLNFYSLFSSSFYLGLTWILLHFTLQASLKLNKTPVMASLFKMRSAQAECTQQHFLHG